MATSRRWALLLLGVAFVSYFLGAINSGNLLQATVCGLGCGRLRGASALGVFTVTPGFQNDATPSFVNRDVASAVIRVTGDPL